LQHCLSFLQSKVETKSSQLMALWEEVKARPICFELMNVLILKAAISFPEIYKSGQFLQMDVEELIMLLSSDEIVIERYVCTINIWVSMLHHRESR